MGTLITKAPQQQAAHSAHIPGVLGESGTSRDWGSHDLCRLNTRSQTIDELLRLVFIFALDLKRDHTMGACPNSKLPEKRQLQFTINSRKMAVSKKHLAKIVYVLVLPVSLIAGKHIWNVTVDINYFCKLYAMTAAK